MKEEIVKIKKMMTTNVKIENMSKNTLNLRKCRETR